MKNIRGSALLTDLYQLTMMQGYYELGMTETAVFEYFVRKVPANRNYLVAAGLEQVLDFLEQLQFSSEELQWLAADGRFKPAFLEQLAKLSFTGRVHAMPEGTVFFADEPVIRVTASLPEAQLIESRLINIAQYQTLVATKAARCVLAAPNKLLVDFGMRRAHGSEAGLLAARASYVAGFSGTATTLAGMLFGIPTVGTMAHSFVLAHDNESRSFEDFAHANPGNVVLLLDTYDTEAAAQELVAMAPRLIEQGITIQGVRLDSGDLAAHARRVRRILDEGGLAAVTIFASGDLDEYRLTELMETETPIDGFGIGSRLDTSDDVPHLSCVYKLQEYANIPRRKRSEGKATWPGRKQVFRSFDGNTMTGDVIGLENEDTSGTPLLELVMDHGRRQEPREPLEAIRGRTAANLAQLPTPLRSLDTAASYPVEISGPVRKLAEEADKRSRNG